MTREQILARQAALPNQDRTENSGEGGTADDTDGTD